MELKPLVSILIPAYNHEKFIGTALDAYLNINYDNFELLIINDGSTDNTPKIIENWIKEHQHQVHVKYSSRENRGCGATLNELINKARGEFIMPSSSDDYLLPHSLEHLVKAAQQFPDKKYYFGDGIAINEKGEKIKSSILEDLNKANKKNLYTDKGLAEEFIARWSLSGPIGIFRSDFFRKVRTFDPNLLIEDWDLYLAVVAGNHALFVDTLVCAYRVHTTNTSRGKDVNQRIKNLQDQLKVACRNSILFKGYLKHLLKKEEILIKMKILFLQKKYIKLFFSSIFYVVFGMFIHSQRMLNKE